jgi:parvulin-like peptidyl-prolyl isomerase
MIRYKLSIVPLVAATALALPGCKPPKPAPLPEATPAAVPASVEATPAASPSATPATADATNQILDQLKQAGVDATVTQKPSADTKPIVLPDVVASVNGQQITKEQLEEIFKAAVQSSGTNLSELSNEQKLGAYNQLLQELIMDKLVAAASSKEKVTDADVDAEIAKIKKQFPDEKIFEAQLKEAGQSPEKLKENIRTMLQQQAWMKSQVKVADVTEAKAKEFYDSNKAEFEQPETVKASHILFMVAPDATEDVVNKQKDAAIKAAARAAKGEDFTALAKELSEEPGAKESGGDLGFFSKDRMVPEFATVAFAQKVGDVGEPVKTQFGWHIIKVTDKKAAGTVPFADVKDQIIGFMKSNEQRQAVQGVLNKLKESAKIETFLPTAG